MDRNAQSSNPTESSRQLLDEVYQSLGYEDGELLNAVKPPPFGAKEEKVWLDKGDWLELAQKVGAERIFFVKNDPVIVFWEFTDVPTEAELLNTFRRVWCMARPQRLFIAQPGELEVYSLNQTLLDDNGERVKPLVTVERSIEVLEKLKAYRRENVESGYLPEDDLFGKPEERADRRLIQDLKNVRQSLIDAGLKSEHAHALIGRSIFIRYLEDRGILTAEYFERIASGNHDWLGLLAQLPEKPDIIREDEWTKRRYYNVLRNKEFTYALFDQLAYDFNGDMFPKDETERLSVRQSHLNLLRSFLLSDTGSQQNMFFWAYDFEIIPIELISSIYEEFYHKDRRKDDTGTYYTPGVLVEFVLSQLLPSERLASRPKILDPACGSGIFLVEAFRRIVRHRVQTQGRLPSSSELRHILRDQIRGIEINSGAARVAAFSLYLALLHYQEPPDILAQLELSDPDSKPLPHLIFNEQQPQDVNHYHVIFDENAFALTDAERSLIQRRLDSSSRFKGRKAIETLYETSPGLPIEPRSFDIIVGNPPWGRAKNTSLEMQWCNAFDWPIGDNELSQAFIARTLSLLKPGGTCGFLVKVTVFLTHYLNSQKFRQRWLDECTIKTVVNFTHVREAFFNDAIAPFAFVHYKATSADSMHRVRYWSAKRTKVIDNMQSVILSLSDIRQVWQSDLRYNSQLWKVYWWGSHRDAALIKALNLENLLEQFSDTNEKGEVLAGRGFEGDIKSGDHKPSKWLKRDFKTLPTKYFERYGILNKSILKPVPDFVHRLRERWLYEGWRLLIKRGITQANETNGRIEARLENEDFCYRHSIYGIRVDNLNNWQRKVLVGILWSSLARYYFFMTASSWGTWHHEIRLSEILNLPIRLPENSVLRRRIVRIVDELRDLGPIHSRLSPSKRQLIRDEQLPLFADTESTTEETAVERLSLLERQLDEAIFDLYGFSEAERDLVQDMCEIGLEFFYRHSESKAIHPVNNHPIQSQGTINDLPMRRDKEQGLEGYLYAFLSMWNDELNDGEFRWRVIRPANNPMLAIEFSTQWKESSLPALGSDNQAWANVLERLAKTLQQPISHKIYIDGMVRVVTDTEIYIIKRNEQRLWTRSMAREDADATLLQAIYLQEAAQETR